MSHCPLDWLAGSNLGELNTSKFCTFIIKNYKQRWYFFLPASKHQESIKFFTHKNNEAMLVESMNPLEITLEIMKDFKKLRSTTAERLGTEYDRERRKLRIETRKTYPKAYPIKTASKNTWLLFISKAPGHEKYKGRDSIIICYVVYYYDSIGLRVFHRSNGNTIDVFNGHFFKRYNERMNLKLDKPLEIVTSYFLYGGHTAYSIIRKNDKAYTIGISSEGILLGEFQKNNMWIVNKTFISRDLARPDQDEVESELIDTLKVELENALSAANVNEEDLDIHKNVVTAITKNCKD